MRILVIIAMLFPGLTAAETCPRQRYDDPQKQPDYNCPSPGEDSMVPRVTLKASVELKKAAKAPWSGILLDQNRVLVLGLRIKSLRRIRWTETIQYQERRKIESEYLKHSHALEKTFIAKQRDNWKKMAKEAYEELVSHRKWYNSRSFWFAAGMIVTAAAATGLAFGLRK